MTTRPPDETIGTEAATELYDLLRIAVDATRSARWRPGDSLESLLAPAVVAIAAEAGKAVRPHADEEPHPVAERWWRDDFVDPLGSGGGQ